MFLIRTSRADVFCEKGFLKISQRPATLLKRRLWHRCFPVIFVKFLKTPFSIEQLRLLLLSYVVQRSESEIKHCFCLM